jgi:hypothetical protein
LATKTTTVRLDVYIHGIELANQLEGLFDAGYDSLIAKVVLECLSTIDGVDTLAGG